MISVEATDRFLDCLRKRSLDRAAVFDAMHHTAASWGRPHLHGGAGIRRLHGRFFECRCGRQMRLVFRAERDALVFDFAGDHDEVRAYLKARR